MNQFHKLFRWAWSVIVVFSLAFAMGGCEGDDGAQGPAGATGATGQTGPQGEGLDPVEAAVAEANVESCGTCHEGAGGFHQAVYADAYGPSDYAITMVNVSSVANVGGGFDLTIDFSIDYQGQPYTQDAVGEAPSVGLGFRPVQYDGTDFVQVGPSPFPSISTANAVSTGGGGYTLTTNVPYDVSAFNSGAIVGAVYVGAFSFPDNPYTGGGSVQAYSDVAFDAVQVGLNAFAWESPADVNGCVRCHGAPYRKHGNIQADVTGAPVFAQCKTCHFDNRVGGHEEWQYMVDDPENWATGGRTDADIEAAYAYTANLMNVTHMSHAMELPYPMTMANCATCHTGAKLADVLDNSNFTAQTCKSCHVVDGVNAWPALDANTPAETYAQTHRAPPLKYLWAKANVEVVHNFADINTVDCTTACHGTNFSNFSDYHTGYNEAIYDDTGQRYEDLYSATIADVSLTGNLMTIDVTANDVNIVPEVLVSFYGWDTKNFIVASHERDASRERMEYELGSGGSALFTEDAASVAGDWSVTLDVSAYVPVKAGLDTIPNMIADGRIKTAQVTVTPMLTLADGTQVALEAKSAAYDIVNDVFPFEHFTGTASTVEIEKCNACHDMLAETFHRDRTTGAPTGRGGTGVEVCKNCHVTTTPGSHLEMQSRAIDSYVHAIHAFQPFDEDDVYNDNDPVELARNVLHKEHTFPRFTILACEACHREGTYNVPAQNLSMPGVQRASWSLDDPNVRFIGTVPEMVQGAASRACGSCHRAQFIKHDAAGDLVSFNAHTGTFGTFVENDPVDVDGDGTDEEPVLWGIIDKIMSFFE